MNWQHDSGEFLLHVLSALETCLSPEAWKGVCSMLQVVLFFGALHQGARTGSIVTDCSNPATSRGARVSGLYVRAQ